MKQKKIALINDITGFGRCSTTVELPIISALKVQACPFPTAILSAHTGFPAYFMNDYTQNMRPYMKNWQKLHLHFDGILTGFLSSQEQIKLVLEFIEIFKNEQPAALSPLLIVDPVMGDNGKLYSSYTPQLCKEMKKLLADADIITPNLTEACNLLDMNYPEHGIISNNRLFSMCEQLTRLHTNDHSTIKIIITGINRGKSIGNFIYENNTGKIMEFTKIGREHSGTGDAFVAIIAASLVKNESLISSVAKAAEFVKKSLIYTEYLNIPWNEGICFEEYLTTLK
ncbi:pyridoxamine kinase [Pectinatus sottacetonis]|uniref:pyridoxamine kinase n=1 Tax=Pectinatus sottacetonis TaxID=1002795 RepID=UPI0018C56A8E|nr:pyridoxamine kinase [Pectinatus sottacetonis]